MKEHVSMKSPELPDPHPFAEKPTGFNVRSLLFTNQHVPPITEEEDDAMRTLSERIADGDTPRALLPTGYDERKKIPIALGFLDYFPAACIAVAEVSEKGNTQHNPGEEIHWARGKSMNQSDTMIRHFLERGTFDTDGVRHSAKMAWRALAILQLELEAAGAPVARGAKYPTNDCTKEEETLP